MPETVKPVLIYCTFPEIGAAEKAGEDLVRRDLCACVNIWPGVTSVYRWEGTIERASKVVMIIKTRSAYLEWIMQNSNPPPGQWPQ